MNRRNFLSVLSGAAAAVAGGLGLVKSAPANPDGEKLLEPLAILTGGSRINAIEIEWFRFSQREPTFVEIMQKIHNEQMSAAWVIPESMLTGELRSLSQASLIQQEFADALGGLNGQA